MPVFYLLINVSFIVVVLSGNLTAVVSVLNTIIINELLTDNVLYYYIGILNAFKNSKQLCTL